MPSASFSKFNSFVEALAEGVHDFQNDTLKVALSNSAPAATNSQLSAITQIANGNGYTTGGTAVTLTSSAQSSGTYKLILDPVTFTASGGSLVFQYAVLYNDTAPNDELIGYYDLGATTLTAGQSLQLTFDATNGAINLV